MGGQEDIQPTAANTDTEMMELAPAEPLSPELVLVCPELREAAFATARDFTVFARAPAPEASFGTTDQSPLSLLASVRLAAATCFAVTLLTLVLTLVADAVAMR